MAEKKARDFEPLPYYRWYWRDFRSSRAVQRLGYVARGLYRELLDECWAKGFIPDDLATLADICGCPEPVMRKQWKELARFFVRDTNGVLFNERIENERSDSDKVRAARSRAGKTGADKRWQTLANDGKSQQQVATDSSLLSSSSSSSSSEQSKSSSSAVAPLATEVARAPAGFTLIKDAIAAAGNGRKVVS